MSREERIVQKCFTCRGKKLLPIGRGDFLECPDCEGTGELVIIERRVEQSKVIVPMGGL